MSIYTYLKAEHKEIKSLMSHIAVLGNDMEDKKVTLFNELKQKLTLHAKAEEKAFYQPLKAYDATRDEVLHGKEEHKEAEDLLEELTDESLSGAAWQQKFLKLKDAVEHHIEEEETEIFNDAKSVLDKETAEEMESSMKKHEKEEEKSRHIEQRVN